MPGSDTFYRNLKRNITLHLYGTIARSQKRGTVPHAQCVCLGQARAV